MKPRCLPVLLGLAALCLLLALASVDAKPVPISNSESQLLPLVGLTGSSGSELNCLTGGFAIVAFSDNVNSSQVDFYDVSFPETDSVWYGLVTSDPARQAVYFWLATDQGGAFAENDGLLVGVKVQKQKQTVCGGLVSAPFVSNMGPIGLNFYNGSVWGWEATQQDSGHLFSMNPNSGAAKKTLSVPADRALMRDSPSIITNNGTFYTVMAGQDKQYLYIHAVDLNSLEASEIKIGVSSPIGLCFAWDYDNITDTVYGICASDESPNGAKYLGTIDLSTLEVTLSSEPFVDDKYQWGGFTIDPINGYAYVVAGPLTGGNSLIQASLQTGAIANEFPLPNPIYDLAYAPWLLSN